MKTRSIENTAWMAAGLLAAMALLLTNGCNAARSTPPAPPSGQAAGAPARTQPLFASDSEASDAMLAAVKAQNHDQVHRILGPAWKDLVSGDKVEDAEAFKEFTQCAAEHTRLEEQDDTESILHVGNDDWAFPIPIVKTPEGKWFFDTEAGKTEILARRIGENELSAIDVCRQYVAAQREYDSKDRDASGVHKFAQRIMSTPGKMDGLYWSAAPGQEQSPFGHLLAEAAKEGYKQTTGHPHEPYLGYHFRVLKGQGPAAPGGAHSYLDKDGNMVDGFALVAFPVDYESSGIMTFIVNQQGEVYQKDLGPQTTKLARQMTAYNPDSGWAPVKE